MTPFESDGNYIGIPYRVLPDSSIEAILPAGLVKFKNMDQFIEAANAQDRNGGSHGMRPLGALDNSDGLRTNMPVPSGPLDYHSILIEAIQKAEQNSAQLRALVYERARFNLKQEFLFGYSQLGLPEIVQQVTDFERAVARIEASAVEAKPAQPVADAAADTDADALAPPAPASPPAPVVVFREQKSLDDIGEPPSDIEFPSDSVIQIMPPAATPPIYEDFPSYVRAENRRLARQSTEMSRHLRTATLLLGGSLAVILLIGGIFAGALWYSSRQPSPTEVAHKPLSHPATAETPASHVASNDEVAKPAPAESPKPAYPLPTSFGIYALSDDKLSKLETLPIKVPDPRVALSAEITKPSTTTISGNKPAFIIYRRDLLNNAPEKVTLRVIAQVMRETKFVGVKPITDAGNSWRVRSASFDYRISPVPGQSEMVIARPANDQPLAAGRYALVVGGFGYDFTVEGPIQSTAHCLESFQASNGTVFSECRKALSGDQRGKKL